MTADSFGPPARPNSPPNRLDALLTLRGIACCLVIVAHCGPPRESLGLAGIDWSWLMFAPGGVAVRVFFSLSGYLMGKGFYTQRYRLDRPGILRYFQNRATRILPLYYACVVLSGWVVYPHLWQPENWGYLIRLLTFTYEHSLPIAFNAPLWSLSTEVQFYAIVPLIFLLSRNYLKTSQAIGRAIVSIILLLTIYRVGVFELIQQLHGSTENNPYFIRYIYTFLPANLDAFLVGFWLNPIIQRLHHRSDRPGRSINQIPTKALKLGAIGGLILLYLLSAFWKYQRSDLALLVAPTLTVIATGLFIFAVEHRDYFDSIRNRKLSRSAIRQNPKRSLEILGVLSFGMYVWHYPLLHQIAPLIAVSSPLGAYGLRLGLVFVSAIALATLSYFWIEVPAIQWRKKAP